MIPGTPTPTPRTASRPTPLLARTVSKPGHDLPDDHGHIVLGGPVKRVLGLRALGHGEVEQLDPGPRLADVDADDVAVLRVHPEHRPRPPAVGLG